LYLIHQGKNDETFEQIEGATTASEAWIILSNNYKGDDKIKRVRLQTLRCQYELLQMETTETIDVYINKVLALTNQMKSNGETHSEQAKVEKILRSLTPRFEHVVAAIEEANDISKMIVRLLSCSLRAHEQRMNDNNIEKSIEQASQAQASIEQAIINMVAISAKVVVARIMEALDAGNVVAENEEAFIINQMLSVIISINMAIMQISANQKVIIMLPIVFKKTVITYKMKRIIHY